MNDRSPAITRQLWIRNGSILLVEFVLLAISVAAAFIPMNNYNTAVNVSIAGVMALIGLLFFMDLVHESTLLRLAAVAGFFFLIIMFPLTFADYFTRP